MPRSRAPLATRHLPRWPTRQLTRYSTLVAAALAPLFGACGLISGADDLTFTDSIADGGSLQKGDGSSAERDGAAGADANPGAQRDAGTTDAGVDSGLPVAMCPHVDGPKFPTSTFGFSWTDTANALAMDDAFATGDGLANASLSVSKFGFALPATAVISGLQVDVRRKGPDVHDKRIEIRAGSVRGSTRGSSAPWPSTNASTSYGGFTDDWDATWNAGDFNASATVTLTIEGPGSGFVDGIALTVFYSSPCD